MEKYLPALWGLGIFLFGMVYLENSLKEFAGRQLKEYIKKYTSNNFKSVLFGTVSTAVLQSSSVVSLITLSLVGAGIMKLAAGVGVIFGANIGTTTTAWIITLVGFKIKIDAFSIAFLGIGGLLVVFAENHKKLNFLAKFLIGFGLIFLGLAYIKESMDGLSQNITFDFEGSFKNIIFVGIGFLITAIIQSSSASSAIAISAFASGVLDFNGACAFFIGANIGTTITAIIAAIGGTPDKKRLAAAHFLFNFITSFIVFFGLNYYSIFILDILGFAKDPIVGLSIFHTLFNISGVILFFPFIDKLAQFLGGFFKQKEITLAKYIYNAGLEVPEASIEALKKDTISLFEDSMKFSLGIVNVNEVNVIVKKMPIKQIVNTNDDYIDIDFVRRYKNIKKLEMELIEFSNKVTKNVLNELEGEKIRILMLAMRKIVYGAKLFKDIRHNIDDLSSSESSAIGQVYLNLRRRSAKFFKYIAYHMDGDRSREVKLYDVYYKIREENKNFVLNVAMLIKDGSVSDDEAANLININNSIFYATESFLEAAKILFDVKNFTEEDVKKILVEP